MMQLLIIGGGGREHALAWKVAQSDRVQRVYVAPGNAGTAAEPKVENIDIGAEDLDALLAFAIREQIELTIVGPEVPLVEGIVDRFTAKGLACFGPGAAAAQLEGSKSFAKRFMQRYAIPTAAYQEFTELAEALRYLDTATLPIVIKADGLAAGKGVVIAETLDQARGAVNDMLADARFGDAGRKVVIEEFLAGEEASFIVMTDGKTALPMASSQDHKARDDGDTGPNTGGMGAYSPAPVVDANITTRVMSDVIEPVLVGLRNENMPYTGFLYAGLMIMADGSLRVLEFNCRFGDPETQPILARLDSDLVELCMAALDGSLAATTVQWNPQPAIGIVMAANGYPDSYVKGDVIGGLENAEAAGAKVFHAGTRKHGGDVVSDGGRVLCVVATADTLQAAHAEAYRAVDLIDWPGGFCRRDIGHRALSH